MECMLSKKEKFHQQEWIDFIGFEPPVPSPEYTVLEWVSLPCCERQKIQYPSRDGKMVAAYLYLPANRSKKYPGIVVSHQTGMVNIDEAAGLAGNPELNLGEYLAAKGEFYVICPMNWIYYYTPEGFPESLYMFQKEYPGRKGMARMLEDSMDAVSLLQNLPGIDPERIGAAGHSLGGKLSFYLTAFDERIKASACSEFGIGIDHCNYCDPQYLGSEIKEPDFGLSHHDLLGLIAPRPLCLCAGEAVDGERSLPYIRQAQAVFPEGALSFLNHGKGHTVPADVKEEIYQFMKTNLTF